MRNLLWKFAALLSVTGLGFMVVLQVMEGLSAKPDSAAAAEPKRNLTPTVNLAEPTPLATKETVAFADPFGPAPNLPPQPAPEPRPEPIPASPFPSEIKRVSAGEPVPLPTPVEYPSEFPVPAAANSSPPAFPQAPESPPADLPSTNTG